MKSWTWMMIVAAVGMAGLAACDRTAEPESRSISGGQVTTPFDAADLNKDGTVSRGEASAVAGLEFSQADLNADATLSRQEYASAMQPRPRG